MAWPEDRLTTYAPGAEIKSADLNALQDAVIAGKQGVVARKIGAGGLRTTGGTPTYDPGGFLVGSFNGHIELPMPDGAVLTEVKAWVDDSVGASISVRVYRLRMTTAALDAKSDAAVSAGNDTNQALIPANLVLEAQAETDRYVVLVSTTNAAHRFYGLKYKYKLP
jgi:hypothetical protein